MKDQAIQYLAFDVHRSTIVATARDHSGAIVMRATVPTEASAVLRLARSAGPRVHVAFEEGTQAQWLHDVVAPHAERVVVCDIRGERKQGNKGDRLDADRLSERLRTGSLRGVFHGAKTLLTLKELVRNYNNLVEDGTRVMQRIKALFRARAIDTPGVSVYRATQRDQWLARVNGGARLRAAIAEARRQPGWRSLRSLPFLDRHPVSLPHQARSVALRRTRCRDAWERRAGVQRRHASSTEEGHGYSPSESESQSHSQIDLQGGRECSECQARPAVRSL